MPSLANTLEFSKIARPPRIENHVVFPVSANRNVLKISNAVSNHFLIFHVIKLTVIHIKIQRKKGLQTVVQLHLQHFSLFYHQFCSSFGKNTFLRPILWVWMSTMRLFLNTHLNCKKNLSKMIPEKIHVFRNISTLSSSVVLPDRKIKKKAFME